MAPLQLTSEKTKERHIVLDSFHKVLQPVPEEIYTADWQRRLTAGAAGITYLNWQNRIHVTAIYCYLVVKFYSVYH